MTQSLAGSLGDAVRGSSGLVIVQNLEGLVFLRFVLMRIGEGL
ncbi:MAG: hypothetical protein QM800_06920 [Paludibacter sp.]